MCGIDRHSSLLVADEGHCVYQILDTRSGDPKEYGMLDELGQGKLTSIEITGENIICDAKLDEEGN